MSVIGVTNDNDIVIEMPQLCRSFRRAGVVRKEQSNYRETFRESEN